MVAPTTKLRFNGPGGTEPKACVSCVANWHDGLGRAVVAAHYGTTLTDSVGRGNVVNVHYLGPEISSGFGRHN